MGADQTLVQAAMKESLSAADISTPDLTNLYKSTIDISRAYSKIASTMFDRYAKRNEAIELGRNNQMATFQKTLEKSYESIIKSESPMSQKVVDAVEREIRRIQSDFEAVNTYGKSDTRENQKARLRLNLELQKVVNQAVKARETFEILYDNRDSWIEGVLDADVIAAQNKMMSADIDNDPDVQVRFVDGKLTFFAQNFKKNYGRVRNPDPDSALPFLTVEQAPSGEANYNLEQMMENFPPILLELDEVIFDMSDSFVDQAGNQGKEGQDFNFNEEEFINEFNTRVRTKEHFRSLAMRRIDGFHNTSFLNDLKLNGSFGVHVDLLDITFKETFEELFKQEFTEDGVINEKDLELAIENGLMNEEDFIYNYDKMIKALTDIDDKNFDLNRSRKLLAHYLATQVEEDAGREYDVQYRKEHEGKLKTVKLYGTNYPAPKRKDQQLEVAAIQAIERTDKEVVIQGNIYLWDQSLKKYVLYAREGAGYSPYPQDYLNSLDKYQYTKEELINRKIRYYKIPKNYVFKKGR
tara:strand:- start:1143 stop:2714 length:1572 start_codon:yes stop_codon:yes gene_type:complete